MNNSSIKSRVYYRFLNRLISENTLQKQGSVLVVCGGPYDEIVLRAARLKNVLISAIKKQKTKYYKFQIIDAQKIPYRDKAFDYVIVHAGLHHCRSPHAALLEMYRVARKGVLVFEAQDNLFTRILCKLNLAQDYEFAAVSKTKGGVNDTKHANYVYRWSKRDVEKTIRSYDYMHDPHIIYHSEFYFPPCFEDNNYYSKNKAVAAKAYVSIMNRLAPHMGNLFCFYIDKERRKRHKWVKPFEEGIGKEE